MSSDPPIPFNRPGLMGGELARIGEVLASGQISGSGDFGRRCEKVLSEALGVPRTLLVTSFRGEIDKYTWCDLDSSYVLSDVLAAILFAQLQASEAIAAKRPEGVDALCDGARCMGRSRGRSVAVRARALRATVPSFYIVMSSPIVRGERLGCGVADQKEAALHEATREKGRQHPQPVDVARAILFS